MTAAVWSGPLVVASTDEGAEWVVVDPLIYRHPLLTITVPEGFATDFASVPAILRPLLPSTGRHTRAAVVHDWLYRKPVTGVSRRLADALFLDAMESSGVAWWRRTAMWLGVRVGGWVAWRKSRRDSG